MCVSAARLDGQSPHRRWFADNYPPLAHNNPMSNLSPIDLRRLGLFLVPTSLSPLVPISYSLTPVFRYPPLPPIFFLAPIPCRLIQQPMIHRFFSLFGGGIEVEINQQDTRILVCRRHPPSTLRTYQDVRFTVWLLKTPCRLFRALLAQRKPPRRFQQSCYGLLRSGFAIDAHQRLDSAGARRQPQISSVRPLTPSSLTILPTSCEWSRRAISSASSVSTMTRSLTPTSATNLCGL